MAACTFTGDCPHCEPLEPPHLSVQLPLDVVQTLAARNRSWYFETTQAVIDACREALRTERPS